VACSNFGHFRLHSEGAKENGHGTSFPDAREQILSTVRMIAVDDNSGETTGFDGIRYRLFSSEKARLKTPKLNHKSQQRSDYLLARENQHITQRRQPKIER